ncbi:DinB family protein [Streptomyces sp. ISL-12]|uniref:maleylpyruvate isomerase N-terminal domain-containing protein n=1 Tax=Streptomyces sp. ISL-12 TaxID=2819177 RepID=UPI001BEC07FC|nr:maleylpyruvate isomerase N-terminal domain-containing protein [Streptomyces sp. ISL-12]MBT2412470.1 DinB family protein [Streptomyces sp. ISL-12]
MDHQDVQAALAQMLEVLEPRTGEDWTVPAGPLEWSCQQTAAHIGHDLLAYAGQLAASPADAYLPFDLRVRPTASPAEALQVAAACGGLLGSALATADPSLRAWHWGPCDPTGFAAMGVAEILLHTNDITRGLGVDWLPPALLCAAVLDRLFPDAPPGEPVRVLLWCTGRGDLDGLPRRTSWVWKAARLD